MARANNLKLFFLSVKNAWCLSGDKEGSTPWAPLSCPTTATQPSSGHLYLWRGTWMFLVHSLGCFWFILVQWLSGEIQKKCRWKFPRWGRLEVLLLLVTQQQLLLHLWSSNCRPLGTDEENDLQSGEVMGPAESPSVTCLHREEEGHSYPGLSSRWDRDAHLLTWLDVSAVETSSLHSKVCLAPC